jgi:hypothetical protein
MAHGVLPELSFRVPLGRLALLLAVLLLGTLAGPGTASAGHADGAALTKKKPPTCKAGTNKKKCRCPTGSSLKKNKKGYRCAKKAPAKQPGADTNPETDPVTEPGADGGTVTPPAPSTAPVRNDQALVDALTSAAFYKTYSGGGYGSYAYNFLPTVLGEFEGRKLFSLRYCTYYYAVGFTADRGNYNGVWAVQEGYTHPEDPSLVTGVLQLFRQGMPESEHVVAPVAVSGANAAIKTGDGSKYFEPGDYAFKPGQATTDCETWVPA